MRAEHILILLLIILTTGEGLFAGKNLLALARQITLALLLLAIYSFVKCSYLQSVMLCLGAFAMIISDNWFAIKKFERFEFPIIEASSLLSLLLITGEKNLLYFFLGECLFLFTSSIMVIYKIHGNRSTTAGMKFAITSAATAFLFFCGLCLLVRGGHPMTIAPTSDLTSSAGFIIITVSAMIAALLFPFALHSPDTYEGAMTPAASFLLICGKIPFIILIADINAAIPQKTFTDILLLFGTLSVTVPAISLLYQQSVKRLTVNYSTVCSGFYLLLIALNPNDAKEILPCYMAMESFSYAGIFSYMILMNVNGSFLENIGEYGGIGRKYPISGLIFSAVILSLSGFPVLPGFALRRDLTAIVFKSNPYLAAAIVISAIFTTSTALKIVRVLYLDREAQSLEKFRISALITLILSFGALIGLAVIKGEIIR